MNQKQILDSSPDAVSFCPPWLSQILGLSDLQDRKESRKRDQEARCFQGPSVPVPEVPAPLPVPEVAAPVPVSVAEAEVQATAGEI